MGSTRSKAATRRNSSSRRNLDASRQRAVRRFRRDTRGGARVRDDGAVARAPRSAVIERERGRADGTPSSTWRYTNLVSGKSRWSNEDDANTSQSGPSQRSDSSANTAHGENARGAAACPSAAAGCDRVKRRRARRFRRRTQPRRCLVVVSRANERTPGGFRRATRLPHRPRERTRSERSPSREASRRSAVDPLGARPFAIRNAPARSATFQSPALRDASRSSEDETSRVTRRPRETPGENTKRRDVRVIRGVARATVAVAAGPVRETRRSTRRASRPHPPDGIRDGSYFSHPSLRRTRGHNTETVPPGGAVGGATYATPPRLPSAATTAGGRCGHSGIKLVSPIVEERRRTVTGRSRPRVRRRDRPLPGQRCPPHGRHAEGPPAAGRRGRGHGR